MKKDSDNKTFKQALTNFANDFASGDEIRHLADRGFTVPEIKKRLSFPASYDQIGRTVWEHFVKTGKILLEKPESEIIKKVTTVKDIGEYGRVSFRQVVEEIPAPKENYVACDFGRKLRKNRAEFEKSLEGLSEKDRAYILYLPWPIETVWHVSDERMKAIMTVLIRP